MKSLELIEVLLSSLKQDLDEPNSYQSGPLKAKSTLLTLHALFPAIFLPALDLIDRRLITQLLSRTKARVLEPVTSNSSADDRNNHGTPADSSIVDEASAVYYVRSTASDPTSSRGRFSNSRYPATASYEVRTTAWNCTCASFTYAVLHTPIDSAPTCDHVNEEQSNGTARPRKLRWGGLLRQFYGADDVPICKHLLACVIAERWSRARQTIKVREVSHEEMAGWAAGWEE